MPTGTNPNAITATGPLPGIRFADPEHNRYQPHQPQQPKRSGLDWDAHRAPEPTVQRCRRCDTRTAVDLLRDKMCPTCAEVGEAAFTAPTPLPEAPGPAEPPQPAQPATTGPESHVVHLQADTARLLVAVSEAARKLAEVFTDLADALADTAETPVAAAPLPEKTPTAATGNTSKPRKTASKPKRKSPTTRTRRTWSLGEAKALYGAGHTIPDIARRLDAPNSATAIRKALQAAGVTMRDDRGTHSGGRPRKYDDRIRAEVVRLYTDEQLSRRQVAEHLDLPYKSVVTILTRDHIPAHSPAHLPGSGWGGDRTTALRARLTALDVTARQVKDWAIEQGLLDRIGPGFPRLALIDAYEQAHQNGDQP